MDRTQDSDEKKGGGSRYNGEDLKEKGVMRKRQIINKKHHGARH